jgi:hypothetical protein
MTEVQLTQVLFGRSTEVTAQVMLPTPQVLLLRIIKGEAQPHELACQVRLPRQMQVLLVRLLPLE